MHTEPEARWAVAGVVGRSASPLHGAEFVVRLADEAWLALAFATDGQDAPVLRVRGFACPLPTIDAVRGNPLPLALALLPAAANVVRVGVITEDGALLQSESGAGFGLPRYYEVADDRISPLSIDGFAAGLSPIRVRAEVGGVHGRVAALTVSCDARPAAAPSSKGRDVVVIDVTAAGGNAVYLRFVPAECESAVT